MGLFDKKFCDICGEKIGLLGNRKLEDGNLCKDCAKKLSPFFDERRHSTVDQIKQQLEYRAQNKINLKSFSSNVTFGDGKKIYLNTMNGQFVVSRLSPGNWDDENPDIIEISQVSSINLDVREDRDEIFTKDANGQRVSYNPPRYKYFYYFDLKFMVNHPYFDDFTVRLNERKVEGMGSMEYNRLQQKAMEVINTLTPGAGGMNMGMNNGMGMSGGMPMNNGIGMMNNGMPMNNGIGMMNNGMPMNNGIGMMNNAYQQPQQPQPQAQSLVCPYCGTPYTGGAFCNECGAKLPG